MTKLPLAKAISRPTTRRTRPPTTAIRLPTNSLAIVGLDIVALLFEMAAVGGRRRPPACPLRGLRVARGELPDEVRSPFAGTFDLALTERPVRSLDDESARLRRDGMARASQPTLDLTGRAARRPPDPRLEGGARRVADRQVG